MSFFASLRIRLCWAGDGFFASLRMTSKMVT
jgi:hypothetical protein